MRRWLVTVTVALAAASVLPLPAGAEGLTVSAELDGTHAKVSGTVEFPPAGFTPLGVEATGDDLSRGAGIGSDLRGFGFEFRPNGDLVARWSADLPAVEGGTPGFVYGIGFAVNGDGYQLDVSRVMGYPEPSGTPRGNLWKCSGTDCRPAAQQILTNDIAAVFDGPAGSVTATIPASLDIVKVGDYLQPIPIFVGASAFVEPGVITSPYTYDKNDWLDQDWILFVPGVRVDLAVNDPGMDPAELTYHERATVEGSTF
ncbi:MAG TPA: hypothetical protein VEA19_07220, partial [Actinomycetota bacterium]|nr:hypothetical protein [Actinomycetota bacterium]